MIRTCTLLFANLILCVTTFAQDLEFKGYTWDSTGTLHTLAPEDSELGEVVIMDKNALEYAYDDYGNLYEYELVHKIIKVNTNDAIERNNRVYLPLYKVENILINRARVITSSGKVKELDESNIKEAVDEEMRFSFKYYAIEGIDAGSEIEYIYLLKSNASTSGRVKTFQDETEKRNVSFEIISPSNLEFAAKSYNGFPEMTEDTSFASKKKNCIRAEIEKIEGIEDEDFANYEANMMSVAYKLSKNDYRGDRELTTYDGIAGRIYQTLVDELDKKEKKTIKKLIKSWDLPTKEEDKIRAIEDSVKANYPVSNARLEGMDDIATILERKQGNESGVSKLFIAIFNYLEIDFQIVMTSNRFKTKFDKDFASYIPIDEVVFYFPGIDKYMAPGAALSRLGIIPAQWTHNYGLFVSTVQISDYKAATGKVKFIPALGAQLTRDVMDIKMDFGDFTNSKLHLKTEKSGYYAQNYQVYYDFISEEQAEKLNEQIISYVSNDAELFELKVENTGLGNFAKKPLVHTAVFDGSQFISKAGPNYLFKIGDVIGPQAEMYQDKERKLPVENDFNRAYKRTIKFDIPEGYSVKNLDDLKMSIYHEEEGKKTCAFISEYSVDGSSVTVEVNEWYEKIEYPISDFEAYRKVINAAADFNKIVLVLQKQ